MLDLSHIPNSQQDIQIFQAGGTTWQTWRKPKKCNFVWIMCIGGGGGGAGGSNFQSAYSTGGGSGGISRALYNSQQLPDTLYVQVGLGGAGGLAANPGGAGTRSWVALQPAIVGQNMVQGSGTAVAAGGTAGTGGNAAGEASMGQTSANFLTLSNFLAVGGVTAVGSSRTPTPPDITPLTSQLTCPGAGGGGVIISPAPIAYSGASILATSISPLIKGGDLSTVSNGGDGQNGITSWKPFFSTGGSGGGSTYSGTGGNGGNGGIGSGGGGGGSSSTAGGTGGRGGNGLVVIISF